MNEPRQHKPAPLPPPPPPKLDSARLLGRAREVIIVHRGEEYRLRVTRQDKLILTK
ncbi:MAG: hemin uptake protein HemP [Pseudomonadota bacterium]|jgi:hemin uptake protein HemP|nr:hemin uptake protein HemP [Rhodocyclaceae bacterium]